MRYLKSRAKARLHKRVQRRLQIDIQSFVLRGSLFSSVCSGITFIFALLLYSLFTGEG